MIPPAVHRELQHSRTPAEVFRWVATPPAWVTIQSPTRTDLTIELGAGETEAISLAVELGIPAVLMDERKGRAAAEHRRFLPIGTLNILSISDSNGWIDFEQAIEQLRQTSFHLDESIVQAMLDEARARKQT